MTPFAREEPADGLSESRNRGIFSFKSKDVMYHLARALRSSEMLPDRRQQRSLLRGVIVVVCPLRSGICHDYGEVLPSIRLTLKIGPVEVTPATAGCWSGKAWRDRNRDPQKLFGTENWSSAGLVFRARTLSLDHAILFEGTEPAGRGTSTTWNPLGLAWWTFKKLTSDGYSLLFIPITLLNLLGKFCQDATLQQAAILDLSPVFPSSSKRLDYCFAPHTSLRYALRSVTSTSGHSWFNFGSMMLSPTTSWQLAFIICATIFPISAGTLKPFASSAS